MHPPPTLRPKWGFGKVIGVLYSSRDTGWGALCCWGKIWPRGGQWSLPRWVCLAPQAPPLALCFLTPLQEQLFHFCIWAYEVWTKTSETVSQNRALLFQFVSSIMSQRWGRWLRSYSHPDSDEGGWGFSKQERVWGKLVQFGKWGPKGHRVSPGSCMHVKTEMQQLSCTQRSVSNAFFAFYCYFQTYEEQQVSYRNSGESHPPGPLYFVPFASTASPLLPPPLSAFLSFLPFFLSAYKCTYMPWMCAYAYKNLCVYKICQNHLRTSGWHCAPSFQNTSVYIS